jgi:hypothetical protein
MVGNRQYFDLRSSTLVNDGERKATQDVPSGASDVTRPPVWKLLYLRDSVIQLLHKGVGGSLASLSVSSPGRSHLGRRLVGRLLGLQALVAKNHLASFRPRNRLGCARVKFSNPPSDLFRPSCLRVLIDGLVKALDQ